MTNKKLLDAIYYERNKEVINAKKAIRYAKNRESVRAKQAEYYKNNKAMFAQKVAKRHAEKLKRTPLWLTRGHLVEMEGFYEYCKIFNKFKNDPNNKLEVDHIIPLQGKQVSGLHAPWNLQVLTRRNNSSKRSKFKPSEYPEQG